MSSRTPSKKGLFSGVLPKPRKYPKNAAFWERFLPPFCVLRFTPNRAGLLHLLISIESGLGRAQVEPHLQALLPLLNIAQLPTITRCASSICLMTAYSFPPSLVGEAAATGSVVPELAEVGPPSAKLRRRRVSSHCATAATYGSANCHFGMTYSSSCTTPATTKPEPSIRRPLVPTLMPDICMSIPIGDTHILNCVERFKEAATFTAATSRARRHTITLTAPIIGQDGYPTSPVAQYLEQLLADNSREPLQLL